MITQLRMWVALITFGLFSIAAQAQAPAQAPASATSAAPAVAGSEALKRPAEVFGNYKNYLMQRYASDTEAQAIIKRFARHQTGGGLWLGAGAGAIAFVASQTGTTTTSSGTTTVNVSPLGYGILVGLFGGVGIGKLVRFSNDKLFNALLTHEQQSGFPARAANGQ
jgi:TM2 domain-containing membrane protein YozV